MELQMYHSATTGIYLDGVFTVCWETMNVLHWLSIVD